MTVRVRMFAAVREAAGTGETTVAPGPLGETLDVLRERYGFEFAQRLAISTVLIDGQPTPQDAQRTVPDGAEIAVLPPVSGGAHPPAGALETSGAMVRAIASGVLAVAVVAALVAGPDLLGALVTVISALLVLDLSGVLARTGSRPVVVAAFVPGTGLPAAIAYWPGVGWEHIPAFFAAGLAAASVLVLVFGRRHGVTAGLGATVVVSLVVGLGGAGVLLLVELADGFRWALGFLVLAAAADAGGSLGHRVGHRLLQGRPHSAALESARRPLGALVAVTVAATVIALALDPPFSPAGAALIAGVAFVAALGVTDLGRALAAEAALEGPPRRLLGEGLLAGSAGTVLLGAPAAYVLARGLGLS